MMNEQDIMDLAKSQRKGKLEVRQCGNRFIATFYKDKVAAIGNTELEALQNVQDTISRLHSELEERTKNQKRRTF